MFVAVNDEKLIGMIGKFVELAQITQNHFQRNVLTHGDHVKVHDRTDRLFGIGHGGAQLLALFDRQTTKNVVNNALRQVGREVGELVGIQRFRRRHQLGAFHRLDQRFANRIRYFKQNFAVALGLDQIPGNQAFIQRQRLKNVGDVGRVHRLQLLLEFVQMLLMNDVLDDVVARPLLAAHQPFDQLVPGKQGLHLGEALLQVFGVGKLGVFAHGAAPQKVCHSSTGLSSGF